MSDEGRLVAGRYRLVERIGSGAMGVVWRAVDERLNRPVAVKKLLLQPGLPPDEADEAVARCMREGRIAARLHHPNAIAVFDVVDEDGVPCLIMEYLPSVSLAIALNEQGALPAVEVARIGAQVAAALAAAHIAGIVHRDIKPGNILLGDDGSVKITDFGISRATDDVTVTKTGLIAGTPAYLAPEVAIGREPAAASDVFSLGSTLYAAVEGEPPFGLSENTLGLLHAVASGKINPPEQSGPLTNVLVALLATEPEHRPSAAKARDLLGAVARGEEPDVPLPLVAVAAGDDEFTRLLVHQADPTDLVRAPIAVPPPRQARSHKPLVFASAAVAAILGVGAWLMLSGGAANPSDRKDPVVGTQSSVPVTTSESAAPPVTSTTKAVVTTTTKVVPTTTTTAPPTASSPPSTSSSSAAPTTTPPPTTTTTSEPTASPPSP
ncbi:serine/threonine-protein kinase [Actinokineospora sp.]|uniref:serine/threonine-protein kinase n=1 Tax=Actinokineospora sp. TaxID=1872133 RepID=UPI00403793E3